MLSCFVELLFDQGYRAEVHVQTSLQTRVCSVSLVRTETCWDEIHNSVFQPHNNTESRSQFSSARICKNKTRTKNRRKQVIPPSLSMSMEQTDFISRGGPRLIPHYC